MHTKLTLLGDILQCVTAMNVPEARDAIAASIDLIKSRLNESRTPEQSLARFKKRERETTAKSPCIGCRDRDPQRAQGRVPE
eukprot:9741892-Alexandrium_andersonii.AAC.1